MGYSCLVRTLDWEQLRRVRLCRLLPGLFAGFSLLAACASSPPATYDLTPAAGDFAALAGRGQLAVLRPDAIQPADSDRIVVRYDPQSVAYLTGAQWADNCPRWFRAGSSKAFRTRICYARSAGPACSPISISRPAYGGSNWIRRKARQSSKSPRKSLAKADASLPGAYFRHCSSGVERTGGGRRRARRGACPSHARHRHLDRAENLTRFPGENDEIADHGIDRARASLSTCPEKVARLLRYGHAPTLRI